MTVRKSVVDAPLVKTTYTKWLQEVLLLPEGKALLLEGLPLQDARRIRTAATRFAKFSSSIKPDGEEGQFKIYLWRTKC